MYSNWRIKELKDELKKRGASLEGKKAELVERLELSDQNSIFCVSIGHPECVDDNDPDPSKQLPLRESYKDIDSNTILPPIDKTMIRHYLDYTMKKMDTATHLYEMHYLLTVKYSVVDDNTFIKGIYMRQIKNRHYEVDIQLNKLGYPERSHCECPAGNGINAKCQHVAVLLLAVEHMVRKKLVHVDCSQLYGPKNLHTGAPVNTKDDKQKKEKPNLIFEPYPIKNINKEEYNKKFRDLIMSYPNSTMPFKQLYETVNS